MGNASSIRNPGPDGPAKLTRTVRASTTVAVIGLPPAIRLDASALTFPSVAA